MENNSAPKVLLDLTFYREKSNDLEALTFRKQEFTDVKISSESINNWLKANLLYVALNQIQGKPHFNLSEEINIDVIIVENNTPKYMYFTGKLLDLTSEPIIKNKSDYSDGKVYENLYPLTNYIEYSMSEKYSSFPSPEKSQPFKN